MSNSEFPIVVLKFGGTSVSTLPNWETIKQIVQSRIDEGLFPIIVCSALSGISNELEGLLDDVRNGEYEDRMARILNRHRDLAKELKVDADELLVEEFSCLERLAKGAALINEASPRLHARILAQGELMSTRMGAAFLTRSGLTTVWKDVRNSLRSSEDLGTSTAKRYLSANCDYSPDTDFRDEVAALEGQAMITQGFIARDSNGDTVLLGRGGSDTSAAYLAAKVGAIRCEIWTDVPGIYTANPKMIPVARLLKRLDYAEAQEIVSTGAKVLHPRCIDPLKQSGIPIHLCCTEHPEIEGTVISDSTPIHEAHMKAVSTKQNITLVSIETLAMWQRVGFIADVSTVFKKHNLSIDSISTSETNITVSLDTAANVLDKETTQALLQDLNTFSTAQIIGPCAAVSLVGRNIRAILHKLGPALEVFEEKQIYLVSQSATDLNLTFVVDEKEAERLARQLHNLIFKYRKRDALLGATWSEVFENDENVDPIVERQWWRERRDELLEMASDATPLYVYNEDKLHESAGQLKEMKSVDRVFYAVKANFNPDVLKLFYEEGIGFEIVSVAELDHVLALFPDISSERILFTPNFAGRDDYAKALDKGVFVTLDNLHPLEHWPELFNGKDVLVRLDPGQGRGHHEYVHTAGLQSKFGISADQFDRLAELATQARARIIGLHAHTGSGILEPGAWKKTAIFMTEVAERFPEVKYFDLGGGLGVVEKPGQTALDLEAVNSNLQMIKEAHPQFEIWLEPGRFLVASAGVLLAKVMQLKQKADFHYIGVDAGMNALIRPALYGSYHEIINLTRLDEPAEVVANVVGPICETGDTLGYERRLPITEEGDILLVGVTGAYGRAMSSNYNLRPFPEERMLPKKA